MARGDRVELRGFGAFSVKNRPARTGRNPRTGAHVSVDEKSVPFFKTGKEMRERLNKADGVVAGADGRAAEMARWPGSRLGDGAASSTPYAPARPTARGSCRCANSSPSLVLVPLGVVIVMFAVANRETVTISFDPFDARAVRRWR